MKFNDDHVRHAFGDIRQNGIPSGFGPSTRWDIIDDATGEAFPPKAILFLAKKFAGDASRSGGGGDVGTNNALRAHGFRVCLKSRFEGLADEAADIADIQSSNRTETEKKRLINARLGQGGFRSALEEIWGGCCALTGCNVGEILRASHIRPWRESTDSQKLDPNNGLLLVANADALFDRGLMTFDDKGMVSYAKKIAPTELGLPPAKFVPMNSATKEFMEFHRNRLFQR